MKNKIEGNQAKIQDEKALAVLMQTGTETQKQNAFNQLYKASKDALFYKVLLKRFRLGQEEARDAMQEIFMKVFKNIDTYNIEYAFSTWLYTIAERHVIDIKRKENYSMLNVQSLNVNSASSGDNEDTQTVAFQLEDKSADNHELLVRQENAEIIQEAISFIKNIESKKAIKDFFIKDKTQEEISKEMNIPVGTVKTLIFRGKEAMKNYLAVKHPEVNCGRVYTERKLFKTIREIENS